MLFHCQKYLKCLITSQANTDFKKLTSSGIPINNWLEINDL